LIIVIISGPGAGSILARELIEEEIRRREKLPSLKDIQLITKEKYPFSDLLNEDFLKISSIPEPEIFKPKDVNVDTSVIKNKFPKIDYKIKHYKYIPNFQKKSRRRF
jgi:hypothetical protein